MELLSGMIICKTDMTQTALFRMILLKSVCICFLIQLLQEFDNQYHHWQPRICIIVKKAGNHYFTQQYTKSIDACNGNW